MLRTKCCQAAAAAAKSLQLCPTLGNPMDCNCQNPPSMGFPRQEYWSGLPFPFPGDLPNQGIGPGSPTLLAASLLSKPQGGLRWSISAIRVVSILWNSAFKWVYFFFSPLPVASLLFSAICKASYDNHLPFCISFSWRCS